MQKLILLLVLSPVLSLAAPGGQAGQPCPYDISGPINSHPQSPHYRGGCLEQLLYFEGQAVEGRVTQKRLIAPLARDRKTGMPLEVQLSEASEGVTTSQGDIPLYEVTYQDQNLCAGVQYDSEGMEALSQETRSLLEGKAIVVSGHWSSKGWKEKATKGKIEVPVLTLSCLSGVIAKCAYWGYLPWGKHKETGTLLGPYHRACAYAARAMYTADKGVSFTCQGTKIDIYDNLGIKTKEDKSLVFESLWGEQGLVCMARARFRSCSKELVRPLKNAKACKDPVSGPGQGWSKDVAPNALIAVASSSGNTSTLCPSNKEPGCPPMP